MFYVLVKNGDTIIEKQVYAGDDQANSAKIDALRAANPTWVYDEVEQSVFDASTVEPILTQEQQDYIAAKGTSLDAAVAFIARKLGLE